MKNKYTETIVDALILKAESEKEVAMANVAIYLNNPAGIGEHPGILEAVEEQVEKIAEANDKIDALREVERKFGIQF